MMPKMVAVDCALLVLLAVAVLSASAEQPTLKGKIWAWA